MVEELTNIDNWLSLVTLAVLEIVLGIDNIVFLAITAARLPRATRGLAYRLGLIAALVSRLALLCTLSAIMRLTDPFFTIGGIGFGGRNFILIGGGLFLMYKSATEVFQSTEGDEEEDDPDNADETGKRQLTLPSAIVQIMMMDIVLSLDSVITAVGIGQHLWVMATAIILAVAIMLIFARSVGEFITGHPSTKILALAFLLLVGVTLLAEGLDQHVPKGYLYFAMGFAFFVEGINLRRSRKSKGEHKP